MIWKVSRRSGKFPDDLKSVQIIQKLCIYSIKESKKCLSANSFSYLEILDSQIGTFSIKKVPNLGVHNFKSQIWDLYCKHCLWSIFGPCLCTKSYKTSFMRICREFEIDTIYVLYPESFCDKNLAIRKVFAFSDSDYAATELTPRSTSHFDSVCIFCTNYGRKAWSKFGRSALQQKEIPCLWKKSSLFMTCHSR